MNLTRIRIEQWRQFRTPLVITDLQPGINLFCGPNEAGKSTLVEAIQAAFFERHKSGTMAHFQPWGDSAAEPAVALTFDWQGENWLLEKRFLGRARCDLTVGNTRYSGDEAEEQLIRLLGYSLAGRGTSKAEHHGIPGLLWVRQGTLQDVREPVQYAADHLQNALGQDLGAVTSSSGDWVLDQVSKQRGQLLTRTGRPTGEHKKIEQELAGRSAELQVLDEAVATYEEKVDTLARLQADRERIDAARPWEAQRDQARKAEAQLQEVRRLVQEQAQAERNLQHCQDRQKLLRDTLQRYQDEAGLLVEREKTRTETEVILNGLLAGRHDVEKRQNEARKAFEAAEQSFQQARQQARRQRLQGEHEQLRLALEKQQATQATLQGLQQELGMLNTQRQQQRVDPVALEKLQRTQKELDALVLRKEVTATRLRWQLQDGQTITVAEEPASGTGERLLLQAAEIVIAGVGTLHLTPGGKDTGEMAREETRLASDRASLLDELGVPDLAAAEDRVQAGERMDQEIDRIRTRMADLAPDGVDVFSQIVESDQVRLASLAEQIASCPAVTEALPAEDDAERARDEAAGIFDTADKALQQYHGQLRLAQQAFDTAEQEWQRLKKAVEDPERQQARQDASRDLTVQTAAEQTLSTDITQRQAQIDGARPQLLEDDIERFGKSAEALEEAARQRSSQIDRLQTELETLGAQGLADQRGELQQTVDALQRRHAQLSARARALDLLFTLLQEQRQALTRRLQAPLQKHLDHYLRLLFPGAQIEVDENLVPTLLQRAGQSGPFDDLSYGAREQLGLISRLAYADLLQEAGRPTLIILDDALVHADVERLAQMKRVLYDAARRHQVLLFTCHPANWNDLGVPARDLAAFAV